MDALTTRMHATATGVGLSLDPELSCVQPLENGTVRLVASVDSFPTSAEERRLSQSALHAALLEDFSDVSDVDVRVFLPPVATETPADTPEKTSKVLVLASVRIRDWNKGVQDYASRSALQLALSSYHCVVDSYPWVDRHAMRARIPMAVQQTITHMTDGTRDPLLTDHCVDLILPPIESVLRHDDTIPVYFDVVRVIGGTPRTILEFYEVVYLSVTNGIPVSNSTHAVFHRVFVR